MATELQHSREKDYAADNTSMSNSPRGPNGLDPRDGRLPAFGGDFQPALYAPPAPRKFANPAPLGLCGFALTTFLLSLINMQTRGLTAPNLVIASAYAYGGIVQLLAGMWEMAVGNTFGATALSSYGGFWIAYGITLTPGGFEIIKSIAAKDKEAGVHNVIGLWLMAWWIFTTILLACTLKTSVAFFLLFFTLDLAFLLLGIGNLVQPTPGAENIGCIKAGGFFGLCAAFLAWYNAMAGLIDENNSFFLIPVGHFPWSAKGMERRQARDVV